MASALRALWLSVGIAAAAGVAAHARTHPDRTAANPFHVPEGLRTQVDFWVTIYGKYSTTQGVIHDAKYLNKIYEVLDFSGRDRDRSRISRDARKKWRKVLLSLHEKSSRGALQAESLSRDERRAYELFADLNDPDKFINATHRKRLRMQLGQSDRFKEGVEASGAYLPRIERVFREAGLPVELTRLPFVESSFNVNARSKAGASGIWQFILSTGQVYLRIDDAIDERNDPIRAATAAAQLLRHNFEALGNWPMAVTAYNQGRKAMMRAVRLVGSDDVTKILSEYRGRTFGFAGANYYASLLAAIEVERNAEKYFGKITRSSPLSFVEVQLPAAIKLRDLTQFMGYDPARIKELNLSWQPSVLASRDWIPAGHRLRIPREGKSGRRLKPDAAVRIFFSGYNKIPKKYKKTR